MSTKQVSPFLIISPAKLNFLFELGKKISCSMQLKNKTHKYVAFKIRKLPKDYYAHPNIGVLSPGATCDVQVVMRARDEAPPDMQCEDKFLVKSVVVPSGTSTQGITRDMFDKVGRIVGEFKLRIVYVPPSPFAEISKEGARLALRKKKIKDGSRFGEKRNKHGPLASSTAPAKEQRPKGSIYCLKDKKRIKEIEKVEDCFILEFDPYEAFDLSSLSKCLDQVKDAPDVAVVAEKGQVACRDYIHPRPLCVLHPFNKTPHEIHCKRCYCCVCDKPAPCKRWTKISTRYSPLKHCDITYEDIKLRKANISKERQTKRLIEV